MQPLISVDLLLRFADGVLLHISRQVVMVLDYENRWTVFDPRRTFGVDFVPEVEADEDQVEVCQQLPVGDALFDDFVEVCGQVEVGRLFVIEIHVLSVGHLQYRNAGAIARAKTVGIFQQGEVIFRPKE